jgi:ketosteroid isomerase-like protein
MDPAATFLDALARGFTSEIAEHLADEAVIDDPREGRVTGTEPVHRWLVDAHAWLASLAVRVDEVRLTRSGEQSAVEWRARATVAGEARELPIAAVMEREARGLLRAIRLYHSFWPLEDRHRVRGRVLPARRDLALAPPVDAYQAALASGDVEAVVACFEPEAYVREPAGEPWVHRRREGLREFYGMLLANGGGIPLEHGNVVDDGVACAVEYTVVRWGRTDLPPQAGVAVYERGASGLLCAARIYDDVEPPLPAPA